MVFEGVILPEDYTTANLSLGKFSKTFNLGDGAKNGCLWHK